jgi:hypothetical protein
LVTGFKTIFTVGTTCAMLLIGAVALVQAGCGGGGSVGSDVPPAQLPVADITEIYVSPSGDDANAGTLASPVRSFERAQAVLRAQLLKGIPTGGVTVWLRGGVYERSASLELTALDSGSSGNPVTWKAFPGEFVRVVGSKILSSSQFKTTTSDAAVWSRLDTSARGKVLQIDLRSIGVSSYGSLNQRGYGRTASAALELFINGKAQPMGRWPDVDQDGSPYNHGFLNVSSRLSDTSFTVATDRLSRWTTAPDTWLHGYLGTFWADDHIGIQSLSVAQRRITLKSAPSFGIVAGQPWYVYNLLEEITQPGEWYLDRTTGVLYLWPTSDFATAEVQVSVLDGPLFRMNGAQYVGLFDMQLESTRSSLVTINDGDNNSLHQLVLRNAGTSAVAIQGGSHHAVTQCRVLDAGEDGVILNGGKRETLVPGNHVLSDSEIVNNGRFARTYHPAVLLEGVGQTVKNNLMRDSGHSAVLFFGNDHQIEFNEIRNVLSATGDAGAIYTGRDWGARGNVIAHNFIHKLKSIFTTNDVHGIYLDDAVSGITVRGNVVYQVPGNAIQSSGGRDNIITNNVLARNGTAFNTDARAYTWWKDQTADQGTATLLEGLKAMNYQIDPWASRYPEAAAIPNDWAVITGNDGNPWLYPQGTVFSLNIGFANDTWIHGEEHTVWFKTFSNNIANQDPRFVDESALDLTLLGSSPAFVLPNFQDIPFRSIGLRSQAMPPVER